MRFVRATGSLVDGVYGLGVPGAVLVGVPEGLPSCDGGWESPEGPILNRGVLFGCDATPSTEAAVSLDGFSSLCGDVDRCGVMTSGCRIAGTEVMDCLPSLLLVAAGVSGGEWRAEAGGDGLGEASVDPAGKCLRLGVVVPDGTRDAGCEPGNETGSKAWC